MKNGILSNFYFGNITPTDRQMVKGSQAERATKELSDAESRLREMLGVETLTQLEWLVKAQLTLNSIVAEESYIDGFKTGARFMMEILDDSHDELEPVGG